MHRFGTEAVPLLYHRQLCQSIDSHGSRSRSKWHVTLAIELRLITNSMLKSKAANYPESLELRNDQ